MLKSKSKALTRLENIIIYNYKAKRPFWKVGCTAMKKETLTKSEHEIMNLLWHVDRPLTASEIIEQSTDKTWKDSYIHLLINSLLDKGMIRAEGFAKTTKNYARTFVAAVSEEAYAVQQIAGRKPLSTLSVVSIVSALVEQAEEPSALIDAVERMLAEKRKAIK